MGKLRLVLGGARSGKSTYAENWAHENGERVLFIATAQALDAEMAQRIQHHQATRPAHWGTLEAPQQVADAVTRHLNEHQYDTIILDCMTLLVSNLLLSLPETAEQGAVDALVLQETDAITAVIAASSAHWLVVSNEVGMGVVPPTRLGRFYRDALGKANQQLARQADEVFLFVAGLPWQLK